MQNNEVLSSYFYLYPEERKYKSRTIVFRYTIRSIKSAIENSIEKFADKMHQISHGGV
jgi:hypothetical protein